MNEDEEKEEIKKANEAVDRWEDEEVAKRKKAEEEHTEKEEHEVIICPRCKVLVGESDFKEDELSEIADDSIMSKINCVNCGYVGMPIEVDREEYAKYVNDQKTSTSRQKKRE